MATITQTLLHNETTVTNNNPKQQPLMRACFSFAAYSKTLIDHLKNSKNIPIQQGLSDAEFSHVESSLHFTFPPDLHSILREGLPVGPGFPNWRSSSLQQLKILTSLPKLGVLNEVSKSKLWFEGWGARPNDRQERLDVAKGFLDRVAILIPVYRNFYIPCTPGLAGNPVFCVNGLSVGVWGFDLSGFFMEVGMMDAGPAWAVKVARRIEFWSEMVGFTDGLGRCSMQEMYWKLRGGGWNEEEVKEMLMDNGNVHCEKKNNEIVNGLDVDDDDDDGDYGDETLYWTFEFDNLTIS